MPTQAAMTFVRRVYSRRTPAATGGLSVGSQGNFCNQLCLPGCCYDEQGGQICCVTSGNRSLCVSDCFAYRWPGQKPTAPGIGLAALQPQRARKAITSRPGGNSPSRNPGPAMMPIRSMRGNPWRGR